MKIVFRYRKRIAMMLKKLKEKAIKVLRALVQRVARRFKIKSLSPFNQTYRNRKMMNKI